MSAVLVLQNRARRGVTVTGLELVLPGNVTQKIAQVDTDIQVLDRDIQQAANANRVTPAFAQQWSLWAASWVDWRKRALEDSWGLFWGASNYYAQAEQWEASASEWRKSFAAQTTPTSPAPGVPSPLPGVPGALVPQTIGVIENVAKAVMLVALVGGTIYVIRTLKGGS